MKTYSIGDKVTVSNDRSQKIDFVTILSVKRDDLSKEFESQDGLKHEVWEAIKESNDIRFYADRNFPNQKVSDAEFFVEPFA